LQKTASYIAQTYRHKTETYVAKLQYLLRTMT